MKKKIFIVAIVIFIILMCILVSKISMLHLYPKRYSEYIEKYCNEYDVDTSLVYAIIKQESNFQADVKSVKGAIGLMQLMESTAEEVAKQIGIENVDLYDPETNIMLGIKFLSNLLENYDNNERMAIIAYNAGIGNVNNWVNEKIINKDGSDLENVPYKETNMYLRQVMKNYKIYCSLY